MTKSGLLAVAASAAVLAFAMADGVSAQEKPSSTRLTIEHYLDLEQIGDAQISPDGKRIIYTRRVVNRMDDRWDSTLWIMNADGSQDRFLAKGGGARWSPDGQRILYLAEADGHEQVFVRWIDLEGSATQVTQAVNAISDARWSPDGKQIAFTMFTSKPPKWNISLPAAPKDAKWTGAPRIVDNLHYRQDRMGVIDDGETHLYVVPADGGAMRDLTHGTWSVGSGELRVPVSYDWTPDSKTIVVQAAKDFDNDEAYERSQLLAVDVATGATREVVTTRGSWNEPAVSPDGRTVAFIGYPQGKRTHTIADLWLVPIGGGDIKKLAGGLPDDPGDLHWAGDGSGLYFEANDRGTRNVSFVSLNGSIRQLTHGAHMLGLDSISRNGVGAGTVSQTEHPAEVARYELNKTDTVDVLTHVNASWLNGMQLGHTQELTWTSSGGAQVEGWYITPPDFDPSKKYPLILEIHGGPYGEYTTGFNYMWQNFAADGYVVLYLNPRGSTGYGQGFVDGIDHNYPGPDYDDLMSGVDTLVAKGFVDTTHMYVSGCSGGGVLSSWTIGHTNRFAAAAVRCPVIDWISMTGNTDIPLFTYSFFDKPFWEDPKPWLEHSSLMYVGNVTTPTMLMTGQLDRRTPMPQTEEFFAALKVRGVPARLMQFEGEYHGTGSKPSNFMRTQLYMMSWFERWSRTADGAVVDSEKGKAAGSD